MATKSKIQDQTFLFTGTLTEFTREEAEALVETNGGKVLSGVSAKLNFLVVGADAGSKLDKAKALGTVKILTEKEFLKMVPKTASNKSSAKDTATAKKTSAKKEVSSKKIETVKTANKKVNTADASNTIEEVTIGKQVWMAKNLDVTHFRNGDPIPQANTNQEWNEASFNGKPAWCNLKNSDKEGVKFGRLYNWFAVNDPRGLAPEGWRVPTEKEWRSLLDFLSKEESGNKLKSTKGWESKGNGNNESGFNALPGSNDRNGMGNFSGISEFVVTKGYAYWWSSSEDKTDPDSANYFYVSYDSNELLNDIQSKGFGLSIRCIKK